jgi:ribonuclease BN (tRNA processing enzyme)
MPNDETVRVTVLGSAGSHPGPGRACSSYLVEHDGFRLVLDCGNGSVSNLLQRVDASEVDAILLTHRHPDHWADLIGLHYALRYHANGEQHVEVYAPPGMEDFIGQLLPDDDGDFGRVCRFTAVSPGDTLRLGGLEIALHRANHPVECLAVRVAAGGRVVAYSGDSAPTPAMTACARDADLFICDSTWLHSDQLPPGIHMSGREAGEQARQAGVRRLLVTHVWPALDPHAVAAEARTAYDGEIIVAHDLMEIAL